MRVVEYFIPLFSLHVNVAKTKQKTKVPLCEFENYSTSTSTNNFNQSLYHWLCYADWQCRITSAEVCARYSEPSEWRVSEPEANELEIND